MPEQQALRDRAARGDMAAFDALMRETKSDLYRFVRRYVGDTDEAYDLLQEAYAAAWLAIGRYDPARPFEAWLRTIAINKCRDWSRRRRVRRLFWGASDLGSSEALGVVDEAAQTEKDYGEAQRAIRLHRAIADLPPKLKESLILTALEERSQAEVAEILGTTIKTVELRVARARQKLAHLLRSADL